MKTTIVILALIIAGFATTNLAVRACQDKRLEYSLITSSQHQSNSLPALIKALSRQDSPFEAAYIWIYAHLPDKISAHLPELYPAAMIRLNAAALLGRFGPAAQPAVQQLIPLLKDAEVDSNAALTLGLIGPGAKEAVPALIIALQEQRPFAATALGRIGPASKSAEPALEAACVSGPEWLRHESALALRKLQGT